MKSRAPKKRAVAKSATAPATGVDGTDGPPTNAGAAILRSAGMSHGKIAKAVGCSRPTISQLASGKKLPGAPLREKLAGLLAIPPAAWDQTPRAEPSAPTAPRQRMGPPAMHGDDDDDDEKPFEPLDSLEAASLTLRIRDHVERELVRLEGREGRSWRPVERARVFASLVASMASLTKMVDAYESQDVLMRSPVYQRIRAVIERVLSTRPETAKALQVAIDAGDLSWPVNPRYAAAYAAEHAQRMVTE